MANATVSSNSPSASQLIVSGDSSTFPQVMVRSRPPAPASTSPLLNPPSAIASRTVNAMGMTSMPESAASVKYPKNQALLVGLHNGRRPVRLLAYWIESNATTGPLTPERETRARGAAGAARQGGTAGSQASRPCRTRAFFVVFGLIQRKEEGYGELHNRDSRPSAPRDPGAEAPDRRRRHLHGGAHRGGRPALIHDGPVRA